MGWETWSAQQPRCPPHREQAAWARCHASFNREQLQGLLGWRREPGSQLAGAPQEVQLLWRVLGDVLGVDCADLGGGGGAARALQGRGGRKKGGRDGSGE